MAAIISNKHGRNIIDRLANIWKLSSSPIIEIKRHNYIVLLPEIPADTPETNQLLRSENLPDFASLTPIECFNAVGKLAIQVESEVCKVEEKLNNGDSEKTFEQVIHPLGIYLTPLNYAFSTMKIFAQVNNNSKVLSVAQKLFNRVLKSQSSMFISLPIYGAIKDINTERNKLTECQQRVVDLYLLEGKLRGIELPTSKLSHYRNIVTNIQREKERFRQIVDNQKNKFKHTLSHESLVANLPDDIVKRMAVDKTRPKNGPWHVTLDPEISRVFLESCPDRMLRWNIWQAKVSLASSGDMHCNNSIAIEEIRTYRHQLANLLGYKTFAEMSMETKMAGSTENVKAMFTSLHSKSKRAIEKELLGLQEFAMQNGFNGQLEAWDVPYYRKQQRDTIFKLNEFEISQYFPLTVVIDGLFEFCKRLFGISIEERTEKGKPWHPDVKYYEVKDEQGSIKGSFYIDPYVKPGQQAYQAWLEFSKTRNVLANMEPLSYLFLNSPAPLANQPSLLRFNEVETLFYKIGHILQHTFTTAPYGEVSGLNNLEWDVVGMVPYFLRLWLNDYSTISVISRHISTGEAMSLEMHKSMRSAYQHMAAFDLTNELYLGALDLELYTRRDFWVDVMKDVWAEFMPLPLDKKDSHPCSFKEIFCDGLPASYFSQKWAEMMAADAFSAFYEAGMSNENEIKAIGRRFRDTFLSVGGGCEPGEVFRKFRGRNPSVETILLSSGILHDGKKFGR